MHASSDDVEEVCVAGEVGYGDVFHGGDVEVGYVEVACAKEGGEVGVEMGEDGCEVIGHDGGVEVFCVVGAYGWVHVECVIEHVGLEEEGADGADGYAGDAPDVDELVVAEVFQVGECADEV